MKPTVFNYQEYERVVEENKKLNAEVADLRIRIADGDKRDCKSCKHQKADGCSRWNCEYEPRMDDLISRQDAINCCSCLHPEECWDEIRKLPSADRPTGEWEIETDTDEYGLKRPKLVCSKCKKEPAAWDLTELFEFCPNCGAKMRGEEE